MSVTNSSLHLLRRNLISLAHLWEGTHASFATRLPISQERTVRRWLKSQSIKSYIGLDAVRGKLCRSLVFKVPKVQ